MKKLLLSATLLIVCTFLATAQNNEPGFRTVFGRNILKDTTEASWPVTLPGDTTFSINHYELNPKTYDYYNVMTTGKQLITSPNTHYQIHIGYKTFNPSWHPDRKSWERGAGWHAEGLYRAYYGSYVSLTPEQEIIYKKWPFLFRATEGKPLKYFPLAVLDNGEIITSLAENIKGVYNKEVPAKSYLSFGEFKGLYAYDPKTKQTRTISSDALFEPNPQKLPFRLTQDAKMIVSEERLATANRVQAYDLTTGRQYKIELAPAAELRLVGNTTIVVYETENGGRIRMLSLLDGSELLQAPVIATSGFARDPQFRNINLHGDELYFLNLLNNSVYGLTLTDGKMTAESVVPLDTAGHSLPDAGYYLGVTRDYFALVPGSIPQGYDTLKPYPLFAWCFSRKDGKAIFMVAPFYEQRKSATELAKDEEDKCKKLYEKSPFPSGSHVVSKATGEVLIWDVICSCNCYRVRNMKTYDYWAVADNYLPTNQPVLGRCDMCNGKGQYYSNVVVQDDSWKASGLGFYYKRSTDTKWVQQLGTCPKCKGKGVVAQ